MNFIKSRLNSDNFWNLIFWLGMSVGWFVVFQFGKANPDGACIASWSTLLGVPFIVGKAQKITFNKEDGYFNSKGESLKASYPKELGRIIVLTIGLIVFMGFMIDSSKSAVLVKLFSNSIISLFFLIPTLYFIYKNCPIAILFNRHIRHFIKPMSQAELAQRRASSSSFHRPVSAFDKLTNPRYCYLSQNVYNKR
jgi:hypothetical protein